MQKSIELLKECLFFAALEASNLRICVVDGVVSPLLWHAEGVQGVVGIFEGKYLVLGASS